MVISAVDNDVSPQRQNMSALVHFTTAYTERKMSVYSLTNA